MTTPSELRLKIQDRFFERYFQDYDNQLNIIVNYVSRLCESVFSFTLFNSLVTMSNLLRHPNNAWQIVDDSLENYCSRRFFTWGEQCDSHIPAGAIYCNKDTILVRKITKRELSISRLHYGCDVLLLLMKRLDKLENDAK